MAKNSCLFIIYLTKLDPLCMCIICHPNYTHIKFCVQGKKYVHYYISFKNFKVLLNHLDDPQYLAVADLAFVLMTRETNFK